MDQTCRLASTASNPELSLDAKRKPALGPTIIPVRYVPSLPETQQRCSAHNNNRPTAHNNDPDDIVPRAPSQTLCTTDPLPLTDCFPLGSVWSLAHPPPTRPAPAFFPR
eukprot:4566967-Pyramimonas_sp.AAC.3